MTAGDLPAAWRSLERLRPEDRKKYQVPVGWAVLPALEERREEALKEMDEDVLKFAGAHLLATLEIAEFYAVLGDTANGPEWFDQALLSKGRDMRILGVCQVAVAGLLRDQVLGEAVPL